MPLFFGLGGCRQRPPASAVEVKSAPDAGTTPVATAPVAPPPAVPHALPGPEPEAWAHWPMPNARLPGLPHPHDYDTSTPGVVVDRVTGLMWQRRVPNKFMSFSDAQKTCAQSSLAGHHDWRLPSRIELVSLIDTARIQPSIDVDAFPGTPSDWFWTSSRSMEDPAAGWYVYFYFGYPKTDDLGSSFSVRCVRSPEPPVVRSARYQLRATTVVDAGTGLRWQRAVAPKAMGFGAAQAYCNRLRLEGQRRWRVPTIGEILTLIDERADAPMIDREAFPSTPAEPFWTSSTFANGRELAWYVRFDHGSGLYGRLGEPFRVRCVL